MISVLLSVRNSRQSAANCLSSLLRAFEQLRLPGVEFLLIDDQSDAAQGIPQLFDDFRQKVSAVAGAGATVRTLLFTQHQHYTRGLAYGMSLASGRHVLFVSHDMLVTAEYVRTLLAVAAADETIGLVRGVSPYVDCFPQHVVAPPLPIRSFEDLEAFAAYVSRYWGLTTVDDRLLTGDSMLITRAALDKVGVFDPRYFGYFGDIDYGLRVQRAGLRNACAKGAWLWHEGAAAYKDQARQAQEDYQHVHARRMQVVNEAYQRFREKWDPSLPPNYPGVDPIPFERLRALPPLPGNGDYQSPVRPDPAVCHVR